MILSICIPCYKRVNEVRNTLKSIYIDNSDIPLEDFEVVISDNDPDGEIEYLLSEFPYPNLVYYKTTCEGFMNSYFVMTYAKGTFLKLHNSQSVLRRGALKNIIDDIHNASASKASIFYSNGMLNKNMILKFEDYDAFMATLSYWSSWSNGFCIWKEQFDIIKDIDLNALFPHTSIFLAQSPASSYIINDKYLFEIQRIPKRGGHNKFAAFTIEYPSLIDNHYKEGKITLSTKKIIFRDLMVEMLPNLLFNKYIARNECFDISGYHDNIKRFFPWYAYGLTFLLAPLTPIRKLYNRFKRSFNS